MISSSDNVYGPDTEPPASQQSVSLPHQAASEREWRLAAENYRQRIRKMSVVRFHLTQLLTRCARLLTLASIAPQKLIVPIDGLSSP